MSSTSAEPDRRSGASSSMTRLKREAPVDAESPPAAKRSKFSSTVRICVDEDELVVHEKTLARHSRLFARELEKITDRPTRGDVVLNMQSLDVAQLETFIEWLYTAPNDSEVWMCRRPKLGKITDWTQFIKAVIFAESIESRSYLNTLGAVLRADAQIWRTSRFEISLGHLKELFQNTSSMSESIRGQFMCYYIRQRLLEVHGGEDGLYRELSNLPDECTATALKYVARLAMYASVEAQACLDPPDSR